MAGCRARRAGREPEVGTPWRAASAASATRWRSLACTPPGPIRLMGGGPCASAWRARAAARNAGRSTNEPSAIAASIRGRSCSTGRPAPRFRWPTSELPIWPCRQADRLLRGLQHAVRPPREQPPPGRHGRGSDGVAAGFVADAETVEDDQHDGSRPAGPRRPPRQSRVRRGPRGQPGPGRRCRPSRRA